MPNKYLYSSILENKLIISLYGKKIIYETVTNKPTEAAKVPSCVQFLPSHCGVEGNHHFLMIFSSATVLLASKKCEPAQEFHGEPVATQIIQYMIQKCIEKSWRYLGNKAMQLRFSYVVPFTL